MASTFGYVLEILQGKFKGRITCADPPSMPLFLGESQPEVNRHARGI